MEKNQYLAKSDKETIVDHTNELLANYRLLKELYPSIQVNWDILLWACKVHDLGKICLKFQKNLFGRKDRTAIPHGLLSTAFIPAKSLSKHYSIGEVIALSYAVGYHHERNVSEIDREKMKQEIVQMIPYTKDFPYHEIGLDIPDEIKLLSKKYFSVGSRLFREDNPETYDKFVMIKGLLNKIDYAASGHYPVEFSHDFLENDMKELLKKWQVNYPDAQWNDLQKYMLTHQEESVITIAQTGMGKTEAGLLWLGDEKGFFTLPLKAAINAIYQRISLDIISNNIEEKLGLLHSDTYIRYLQDEKVKNVDHYVQHTRSFSLPLTICTLDQLFDFVYLYPGYEMKLAVLSYSKLIIDEIQMYSADLLAYLIIGLKRIQELGGKFAILTATLPPFIVEKMQEEHIQFSMPEQPFIEETIVRHHIKVCHEEIHITDIKRIYHKNKLLVICNTVKKAREIYEELRSIFGEEVQMLHSQFIKKDREEKEKQIFKLGQKECQEHGIWISTQIVEASLDIDFDYLFTELSDLNGLLQRMGRCYRKRSLLAVSEPNCFVYDGGRAKCSGIGYVMDTAIYNVSKGALNQIENGPLTERQKMQMIQQYYTTEKLKESSFYQEFERTIKYFQGIKEYEFDKAEVKGLFRRISSRTIIPKPIFKRFQEEIDACCLVLQQKQSREMKEEERKMLRAKKAEARANISQYQVSVSTYAVENQKIEYYEVNEYEKLEILDCLYDSKIGISYQKIAIEKESYFF